MPLSDRERQILSDIEARLRAEDPRFAQHVATETVSTHARRQIRLATVGFVVGFLLLFGIIASIWIGLAGFALMLLSAVHGGNWLKRLGQEHATQLGGQLRDGLERWRADRRRRAEE
jgi:hypothetical protein